ncbi:GH10281 [Drosophila grimshawi]|uniref:GH10281 n=1 Tax=Drosophila grimshawi TaxID=7222 RepID=B4JAQ0_DROGR|nr:GH10281 [Drosophila grimshawi]
MDILNTSLTPMRFDSHRLQSPIKYDANLATCKARLEALIKDLQSNYAKWQLAQQRGTALCYAIEAKKTRCPEKGDEESGNYPDDLRAPCDKLSIIATIFVDICKNTRDILRKLRGLSQLSGAESNVIFYRTWKLTQFVSFTELLLQRYEQESLVKQDVMRKLNS